MEPQNRSLAQRWFVVGFISAVFSCLIVMGFLQYFTNFLSSTESKEKSEFSLGNREGVEAVGLDTQKIEIKFGSGEIRVDYATNSEINWNCDGVGKKTVLEKDAEERSVRLDFSSAIVDCDITIPALALKIEGLHGEVELRKIAAAVDVQMIHGELFLQPLANQAYRYELNVESGTIDESFESSQDPKALLIKAEMKYGSIETLD